MMRRSWRWKVCAVCWVGGSYICILVFISLINLTDPSLNRHYIAEAEQNRVWSWNVRRAPRGRAARLPWCKTLAWRSPAGPNTALASFPGSGNTWLRYLIQQVTGFYTGSVYKDYALLKNGFPAESVSNGSAIVVKTHEYGPDTRRTFSRAILIIRDPYQAIQAEFNRQSGGHIGHAQPDKYTRDNGKFWENFVRIKAASWTNTTIDWLKFEGPLHIVFFDDLLDNLPEEMRRVIEFLDVDVSDADFDCMMKHKDGIYKRRKRPLNFDPFDSKLRTIVDKCKDLVDKYAKDYLAGSDMEKLLKDFNVHNIVDNPNTSKSAKIKIQNDR